LENYLAPLNNLYKSNLSKFGASSKSVGWKDTESQILRFRILNLIFDNSEKHFSVNDYGCGYGAHLDNLLESGYVPTTYNAYDINVEMLNALQEKYGTNKACQINPINSADISTLSDYSLVSGTFNVMPDANTARWEENIKDRLLQLKEFSKKGFAFNLLSTYVDWKAEGLYYADPLFWFDFCKTEISKHVVLCHDYDLYEWTMLCRFKEDA